MISVTDSWQYLAFSGGLNEYLESQMTSPTPFDGPEEMLGKEAAQSCAKYLNAFQV